MDFFSFAQECAPWVAPETMAAVVKTESGFRPLAIGVNGGAKLARQPETREEAVVTAKWLISNGYNVDLGLGQVSSMNLSKTGLSVDDAFDPCKNVAAAATILRWNYEAAKGKVTGEQAALHAALSAYNTGSFTKGVTNGYVQKVVSNAGIDVRRGATPVVPILLVSAQRRTTAGMQRALPAAKTVGLVANRTVPATEQLSGVSVYGTSIDGVMVY